MRHDRVVIVEEEKWKFNNMLIDYYAPDIAYIPHTDRKNFLGGDMCRYYMQTVFPYCLQSTKKVGAEMLHMQKMVGKLHLMKIELLIYSKKEQTEGQSKFDQPQNEFINNLGDYIFVPLQLPHDETIKYHSNLKVITWAVKLMDWSYENESI